MAYLRGIPKFLASKRITAERAQRGGRRTLSSPRPADAASEGPETGCSPDLW